MMEAYLGHLVRIKSIVVSDPEPIYPYTIVFIPGIEYGIMTETSSWNESYAGTDSEDCIRNGGAHWVVISITNSLTGSWDAIGSTTYTPISLHPEKTITINRHVYGSRNGNYSSVPYTDFGITSVLVNGTYSVNENRQITVDAFDGEIVLPIETYFHDEPENSLEERILIRDYFKITKISISYDNWFYETERRISGVSLERRRITTNRINGDVDDILISMLPQGNKITDPTGLSDYKTPCITNNPNDTGTNTTIFNPASLTFATL